MLILRKGYKGNIVLGPKGPGKR